MALCGFFALVAGYLMGLRFRVMIVVPAEMAACVAAAMLVLVGGVPAWDAGLGLAVVSVAMQVGYGLALAYPLPVRPSAARRPLKA